MGILLNPMFWLGLTLLGVVLLFVISSRMKDMLNNTYVAVAVSLMVALGYLHLLNHYLMDMQGLDYWYLFRQ